MNNETIQITSVPEDFYEKCFNYIDMKDGKAVPKEYSHTNLKPKWYKQAYGNLFFEIIYILNCILIPAYFIYKRTQDHKEINAVWIIGTIAVILLSLILHHVPVIRRFICIPYSIMDGIVIVQGVKWIGKISGLYSLDKVPNFVMIIVTVIVCFFTFFYGIGFLFDYPITEKQQNVTLDFLKGVESAMYNGTAFLITENYHDVKSFCEFIARECFTNKIEFDAQRWLHAYVFRTMDVKQQVALQNQQSQANSSQNE